MKNYKIKIENIATLLMTFVMMLSVLTMIPSVEAVAAPSKYVKSLKVSKSKLSLTAGGKKTVSVTIKVKGSASKKVKVSLSKADKKVVSVKVGKPNKKGVTKLTITAKKVTKQKTATIKLTTVSKNTKNKKLKKTIKVTVNPKKTATEETNGTTTEATTEMTTETTTEETPVESVDKVSLNSVNVTYNEALVAAGYSVDYLDIAKQLQVELQYSDGTTEVVDEYKNFSGGCEISAIDTQTVGDYAAFFTVKKDGKEISIPIIISVCEVQNNGEYKYISNSNIAMLMDYVGTEEDIIVPKQIDGAEVIGGIISDYGTESEIKTITLPASWRWHPNDILFDIDTLESIYVDEANLYYSSVGGVLFDKEQKLLYRYPNNKASSEYTIPDTVTEIRQGAFYQHRLLEKVIIPKTVIAINKSISYAVGPFESSEENVLKEIVVEEGNPYYKSIDGVLFVDYTYTHEDYTEPQRCYELIYYPGCKEDTRYRIPDGVRHIHSFAFSQTIYLEKLVIPDSVLNYGGGTLPSTIKEVYLELIELVPNQYLSKYFLGDGRTIYVKNEEMKAKVEELIEESGYDSDSCIVSDNFDW